MGRQPKANIPATEKARRALELRRAGVTYDLIAQQLGYKDGSVAYNTVKRALQRSLQEPADDVRELELSRLDRLETILWPQALQGDQGAVDRLLKIADRRARYLGLDAPIKQEVEVTAYQGGTDIDREVERLAAELKQRKAVTTE